MKRFLITLTMICSVLYGFCQQYPVQELQAWRRQIAQQEGKAMVNLPLSTLKQKTINWWDGNRVMVLLDMNDGSDELGLYDVWAGAIVNTIQVKGASGTIKDTDMVLSLHQIGDMMLMVMTEKGKIFDILMEVKNNQPVWAFIDLHDVLDGVYQSTDNKQYVFGMPDMYVGVDRYTRDPGIFDLTREERDDANEWSYIIEYGAGRVSHGRPVDDPAKINVPGAGGAGALMGPMMWGLNMTEEGLAGEVLHDEPTVDHEPAITERFELKKTQTPFKGVNGRWPFTSLRPLNRQMLVHFPKEVLRLMRNEIYARHGVKFRSDAAIQAYFDRQPWYQATNKTTALTGLEKLNVSLIKAVEDRITEMEKELSKYNL
ncbi:MAG: YARHG domain-containing protein [Bacteroidaceae bacterium]|nr:YARHG domain-containing protein [Bacteroidaceae bacterium]